MTQRILITAGASGIGKEIAESSLQTELPFARATLNEKTSQSSGERKPIFSLEASHENSVKLVSAAGLGCTGLSKDYGDIEHEGNQNER
mgnify:FL=1